MSARRERRIAVVLDVEALEELASLLTEAVPKDALQIAAELDGDMKQEFVSVAELEKYPSSKPIVGLKMSVGPYSRGPHVAIRFANSAFSGTQVEMDRLPEEHVEELSEKIFAVLQRHRAWHSWLGARPLLVLLTVALFFGTGVMYALVAVGLSAKESAPYGMAAGFLLGTSYKSFSRLLPQLRVLVGPELERWNAQQKRRRFWLLAVLIPLAVSVVAGLIVWAMTT